MILRILLLILLSFCISASNLPYFKTSSELVMANLKPGDLVELRLKPCEAVMKKDGYIVMGCKMHKGPMLLIIFTKRKELVNFMTTGPTETTLYYQKQDETGIWFFAQ